MRFFSSFRPRLPIGVVLALSLVLAVAIPVLLLRTLVKDSAHQAVESEVVRLSLAILDSARLSLAERMEELGLAFDASTLSDQGRRILLPYRQLPLGPSYLIRTGSSLPTVYRLVSTTPDTSSPAGTSYTLAPVPGSFQKGSQTLAVLAENPTRRLWIGQLPFLPQAPESLWLVGRLPGGEATDILALSLEPGSLATVLNHLSLAVASGIYLVTADNTVLPPGRPDFFGQGWAAKALSRSQEGVFFTFPSTDLRDGHSQGILVHVYADPTYLFNLVAVMPRQNLTSSVDAVIDQTTVSTALVAVVLGLVSLGLILTFSRQLGRLTGRLSALAEGDFQGLRVPSGSILLETDRISQGISALASRLEENHRTIEDSRHDLEVRVADRTQSLTRTVEELKRAQAMLVQTEKMAALGRTVAAFTHEINNPLGACLTAVGILEDGVAGLATSLEQRTLTSADLNLGLGTMAEAAQMIHRSLQRAIAVTGSVKNVATDQTRSVVRRYNLAQYLQEIEAALVPLIRHGVHTLEFEVSPEINLEGDPAILYQIFSNLVINSVKHGFEGRPTGRIHIGATTEGDLVTLRYQDDGVGMDSDQLSRIYEPFFTTKRESGGTGLGMSIVYNLVHDDLGGTIHCASRPGGGVEFMIQFPLIHQEEP